jgi:hypothetical protein
MNAKGKGQARRRASKKRPKISGKWISAIAVIVAALIPIIFAIVKSAGANPPQPIYSGTATRPLSITEIPDHITSKAPSFPNALAKLNGWLELPNNSDGSCQFLDDGGYKVTIKNTFNAFFKCPSNISLTDFALQVQMRFLSGNEGGILFRASPQGEHFYYFYIRSDTSWGLRKDNPGSGRPIDLLGGKLEAIKADRNTLFVVASGDEIYLYVNGVSLAQINDKTYSQGKISLAAGSGQDYNSQSEVVFSDMKIWLQPSLVS